MELPERVTPRWSLGDVHLLPQRPAAHDHRPHQPAAPFPWRPVTSCLSSWPVSSPVRVWIGPCSGRGVAVLRVVTPGQVAEGPCRRREPRLRPERLWRTQTSTRHEVSSDPLFVCFLRRRFHDQESLPRPAPRGLRCFLPRLLPLRRHLQVLDRARANSRVRRCVGVQPRSSARGRQPPAPRARVAPGPVRLSVLPR